MRVWLVSSIGFVMALAAAGCSGSDCPGGGDCLSPDGGDAQVGGGDAGGDGDLPDVPQTCDLDADLASSPSCIDDGVGVFVDGTHGDDQNPGTKAMPFKTIAKGIAAAGAKPRVYVCAATYAEDVSLTQANAVAIFGGLACGSWTYDGSRPIVGKSSIALRVDGVTKPLVLSDLTFQAAAGGQPGGSSLAAFVTSSADVTLRRVSLRPGAGADGAPGVTGSNWTSVAQDDPSIIGGSASGGKGGPDKACTLCGDGVNSTGGGGGSGALTSAQPGNAGLPNLSASPPDDGAGGAASCTAGHNGASAPAGNAAPGATVVGKLTSAGWVPANGQDGPSGGPGQGGGGGGGGAGVSPGGGAGGGCGGCGGAGGKGGGGGGASIGLAVVASLVTLDACDLVTVAGGKGGAGSVGQDGQLGGYAGTAVSPGCAGGIGGQGGKGGAGGGGAGGISVGIVYTGQAPQVDPATSIVVPGSPASKGTGGAQGVDDGVDGLAQATLQAASN